MTMEEKKPFIVVRDDGYSPFSGYGVPEPLTETEYLRQNVDYLAEYPGVRVKEIGCGPGYTFNYPSAYQELPTEGLDEKERKMIRPMDEQAFRILSDFRARGIDVIDLAACRCHERGLLAWVRYEINVDFGIPAKDNWPYAAFLSAEAKEHREWRLGYDPVKAPFGNGTRHNFALTAVREQRLAIIRELAAHEVDGVSLDFCVSPPFFEDAEAGGPIMTAFMREARKILDEEGARRGTKIDLVVRLDYDGEKYGLMWKDWVTERLVDVLIPSVTRLDDCWDIPNEEFVRICAGTGCRVLTCIRPFVNTLVWTDPQPQDGRSGIERTEERMTKERLYAKAFLGLEYGSDGVQIAIATGGLADTRPIGSDDEYRRDGWRPVYGTLGDRDFLRKQNKLYSFNASQGLPAKLTPAFPGISLQLRIADDPREIKKASLILYGRGLTPYEEVIMKVNGTPVVLTERELNKASYDMPILTGREVPRIMLFRIPEWWNICKNTIAVPPETLRKGINTFDFEYRRDEEITLKNDGYTFGRLDLEVILREEERAE